MKVSKYLLPSLAGLFLASAAQAQVLFNGDYSQNFASLSTATNVAQDWENNDTIPGWHTLFGTDVSPTQYTPSWQTGISAGVFYHARNTTDTGVSFFGARVTSGTGNATMGLQLTNNTGETWNSVNLSFVASQFYKTGVAQELRVYYSTDATSLTTGVWTQVPDLTYTGIYNTGNAAVSAEEEIASRASLSANLTGLDWQAGENLFFRWVSYRDLPGSGYTGAAGVLAITDVAVIPEPTTYAALFGLVALAGVMIRRRTRKE